MTRLEQVETALSILEPHAGKCRWVVSELRVRAQRLARTRDRQSRPKVERRTLKACIRELDRVFSIYVRQRDAILNGGTHGYCCTCKKVVAWKDADCGHYIGRQHYSTRWDPQNCHMQCRYCNRFAEGMKDAYAKWLGPDLSAKLLLQSKRKWKPSVFELEKMMQYYKSASKEFE